MINATKIKQIKDKKGSDEKRICYMHERYFCTIYLIFFGLLAESQPLLSVKKYSGVVVGKEKIRLFRITNYELNDRYPDLVL